MLVGYVIFVKIKLLIPILDVLIAKGMVIQGVRAV
jgi:hypothetical protein